MHFSVLSSNFFLFMSGIYEIIQNRFSTTSGSGLLRCHILNRNCRTSIQNRNTPIYCFRPKRFQDVTSFEHSQEVCRLQTIPFGCHVLHIILQILLSFEQHSSPLFGIYLIILSSSLSTRALKLLNVLKTKNCKLIL